MNGHRAVIANVIKWSFPERMQWIIKTYHSNYVEGHKVDTTPFSCHRCITFLKIQSEIIVPCDDCQVSGL